MLMTKEKTQVLRLLKDKFIAVGNAIAYVQAVLGPEGDKLVEPLSLNSGPGPLSVVVLDACIASGWNCDPPLLSRLLREFEAHEGISAIVNRLSDPPTQPSPYEARVLVDRRVFLGRHEGRKMLAKLRDGPGYYAGIVNGERLSGKSYTTYFAMHLAKSFTDFMVATVEIPRGTGAAYKAEDLAVALVGGMARSTPLPANLNPSLQKRVQELAVWVLVEAAQSGTAWWFVLDGFDDPDIDPSTFALVEQLVDRISKNIMANQVRLLLLAYGQPVPAVLRPAIFVEQPPLARATVGKEALRECFHEVFTSTGTSGEELEAVVDAAVADVLGRVQAKHVETAEEWLARISEAAQEVVDAVR